MVARRRGGTGRCAFRFDATENVRLQDPPIETILQTVAKKSESIHYAPLDDIQIDHTGMIEATGSRFSHYGFGRLCSSLDIPQRFINTLSKENASLASKVVNDRIKARGKGLLAAMDNDVVEGVVSNRYSRLENLRVAEMAAELTEGSFNTLSLEGLRMRLSNVGAESFEPRPGDSLKGGIDIFNGEDGGASFNVSAYVYRLVCSNGLIAPRTESLGRIIHRGSGIRERAMVILQKSQDICIGYIEKLPRAMEIVLNNLEQKELAGSIQKAFSMTMANAVIAKAAEEAEEEGHPEQLTLYNLVNGMTVQAHDARNLDRSRAVETFASRLLDDGLKLVA